MSTPSALLTTWEMLFEYSPILLTNSSVGSGWAPDAIGGVLPIIAITESINFPLGLLSGADVSLNNIFATYQVLPGTSLLEYDIAKFPFANSTVAANAVIKNPTSVSFLMICPAKNDIGWYAKLAITEAMTYVLDQHQLKGGTYTLATPSQIFTSCVFRGMRDASVGGTRQLQNSWQLDFEKPLITTADAQGLFSSLSSVLQSGGQVTANSAYTSGFGTPVSTASSIAGPSTIPIANPSLGANTGVGGGPPT